jgi:hypothetical protein
MRLQLFFAIGSAKTKQLHILEEANKKGWHRCQPFRDEIGE